MKLLVLTRYGTLGASSRLRFFQYLPHFTRQGFQVDVQSLLDDQYIRDLYQGRARRRGFLAGAYLRRFVKILRGRSFDLLWIEKELFPMLPGIVERLLVTMGIPYVVDLDDAVFHRYDRHASAIVRRLLGKKIDGVMRNATLVIAGSEYLSARAQRAGARWVEVIPTVIDLQRYPAQTPPKRTEGPFVVGWIGSPATAHYLELLKSPLQILGQEEVRLCVVGVDRIELDRVATETVEWSEDTEVDQLQRFDVGVMPLVDGPFERGKCGYKLIQYMACSLPVVASPVGVNREIVEEGCNGFLALTTRNWVQALTRLRDSADLRRRMGQDGRRKVETRYNLQITAPRLEQLLLSAASGSDRARGA